MALGEVTRAKQTAICDNSKDEVYGKSSGVFCILICNTSRLQPSLTAPHHHFRPVSVLHHRSPSGHRARAPTQKCSASSASKWSISGPPRSLLHVRKRALRVGASTLQRLRPCAAESGYALQRAARGLRHFKLIGPAAGTRQSRCSLPQQGPAATVNKLQPAAKSIRVADWQRAGHLSESFLQLRRSGREISLSNCLLTVRFARDSMESTFRVNLARLGHGFAPHNQLFAKKIKPPSIILFEMSQAWLG